MGKIKDLIRMLAIKNRYTRFFCHCRLCGSLIYPGEKMFSVYRWADDRKSAKVCYCMDCIKSKREVLNEVDTDSILYGIANVDSYTNFKKKDYTRFRKRKERENTTIIKYKGD